jgi:hypothetical protein
MKALLLQLRADLAALEMRWAIANLAYKYNFNPAQPRVPAGSPDGGRWTDAGGAGWVRVAANDRGEGGIATDAGTRQAELIIPKHPKDADVDANIAKARAMREVLTPPLNLLWFYEQVHNRAPWDYKQVHKDYADFGNFNYGATGTALGLSQDTLLRAAGWAQQRAGNSGTGEATPLTGVILGMGGTPAYGDDPKDQDWIMRGIQYYQTKYGGD